MSTFKTTAKTSHLKDNSWIRKPNNEDEPVDDDPNFGKTVLSRRKSNEILESSEPGEPNPTKTISTSASVHELSRRFTGSQSDLKTNSTLTPTKTSYTKSTYTSVNPGSPTLTTTTKTVVTEYPKTSTKTTAVTKDGTTTETVITTTESLRSPVSKTPVSSETFSERVKSSTKGQQYPTYSPTKTTTKVIEKTITSTQDQEDKPYDTFTTLSVKDALSPTDSKRTSTTTETVVLKSGSDDKKSTVSTTETVTLRSSSTDDVFKTTTTTKTSSTAEDKLYDTLLPSSVRYDSYSPISSTSSITKSETITVESSRGGESPNMTRNLSSYSSYSKDTPSTRTTSYTINSSDNYSSDRNTYTYSRPDTSYEYTSITSPSVYTSASYRSRSRSDDILSDPIYSSSSVKSVYAAPERTVLEKDLCTTCRKPFTSDAKMVLDDIKIKCHASCFKCGVCNITLGNLKAGDTLWIYKRMVYCENCFEVTKEKWRR